MTAPAGACKAQPPKAALSAPLGWRAPASLLSSIRLRTMSNCSPSLISHRSLLRRSRCQLPPGGSHRFAECLYFCMTQYHVGTLENVSTVICLPLGLLHSAAFFQSMIAGGNHTKMNRWPSASEVGRGIVRTFVSMTAPTTRQTVIFRGLLLFHFAAAPFVFHSGRHTMPKRAFQFSTNFSNKITDKPAFL